MDTFDRKMRSWIMGRVKSSHTNPERTLLSAVRSFGIKGWRRHLGSIMGRPDLAFPKQKIAVFVDGCFWHKCPTCYRSPKSNKAYWEKKVQGNISRAKVVNSSLRADGWKIARFWEHQIRKNPEHCGKKVFKLLEADLSKRADLRSVA